MEVRRRCWPSVFGGQHDGQDAGGLSRISGFLRASLHLGVVVIDVPEALVAVDLKGADVLPAVGIVAFDKAAVILDPLDTGTREVRAEGTTPRPKGEAAQIEDAEAHAIDARSGRARDA